MGGSKSQVFLRHLFSLTSSAFLSPLKLQVCRVSSLVGLVFSVSRFSNSVVGGPYDSLSLSRDNLVVEHCCCYCDVLKLPLLLLRFGIHFL